MHKEVDDDRVNVEIVEKGEWSMKKTRVCIGSGNPYLDFSK